MEQKVASNMLFMSGRSPVPTSNSGPRPILALMLTRVEGIVLIASESYLLQ